MERSTGKKWKKIYEEDGSSPPIDEEDVSITKNKALGDEQPLVNHEEEGLGYAGPTPLLLQKPVAAWATVGLGALFLVVVVMVVRGGTLHAPRVIQDNADAVKWVSLLPDEVVSHINQETDPCEDFYTFSCGAWQKQVEIPADRPSVFLSFSTVNDENQLVLKELMQQGWPLVGELYASCMNFSNSSSTTADDASLSVLSPVLQQIAGSPSKTALFQLAGQLSKAGPDFLTGLSVAADAREATTYALYASQTGLSLPDPQYYLDSEQFDAISDAFHAYVVELFLLAGWESGAAAARASAVIGFEQTLAPLFVPKEKLQDPLAAYNRMSVAHAAEKYPLLFAAFVNGTGLLARLDADVIVETPAFFERVEALVTGTSVTLDTLKAVLTYQYIGAYAGVLSEPFVQASFSFFARTLRGQKTRAPRWKVCLQRVTDNFPDLVGKYFALLRFDQASERLARQLVEQVQTSLRSHLGRLEWLDAPTRQAAIAKLGNMTNLIGHSTRAEHFPYELRGDAPLADNMRIVKQHAFERVVAQIGGPVDRNKWAMTSAAVNAYYQPTANQIVFPAGILQPPFFSCGRHPARNFGAIGSIIGHELTHGFDASGRYFAGDGNLQDWWSNATSEEFSQRTECLVNQYNAFAVASGADPDHVLGYVNGNYTLSENIADNGGVKLSFAAYQAFITAQAQELSKMSDTDAAELAAPMSQAERNLPADVADKLFFVSFAQAFCAKSSDASMMQRLASDPHSPERWRINGVASNSRDFARVFSCPAGAHWAAALHLVIQQLDLGFGVIVNWLTIETQAALTHVTKDAAVVRAQFPSALEAVTIRVEQLVGRAVAGSKVEVKAR